MKKIMYLKVYFESPVTKGITIPLENQSRLNSFIHHTLGKNNKWHDAMSFYSISSLQGVKLNKEERTLFVEEGQQPYIIISAYEENNELLNTFIEKLPLKQYDFYGLHFDRFEIGSHILGENYDKIHTISPILLIDKKKWRVTIKDERFMQMLYDSCINKLKQCNIVDNTFALKLHHPQKAKERVVKVRNTYNKASQVQLYVFGGKKTRMALYSMGLGQLTGCGYGAVKIID